MARILLSIIILFLHCKRYIYITQSIRNNQNILCGNTLRSPGIFQYAEAMVWYLKEVNRDTKLLPGIDLGYIIVDDCAKDQVG